MLNYFRQVLAFNNKTEMSISGPACDLAACRELFKSDTPLELIRDTYQKEQNEEEGDNLVNQLVTLLASSPSLKIYEQFASEVGYSFDKLKSMLALLLKTVLREADLVNAIAPLRLESRVSTFENVSTFVLLKKPLNRNVWEYDENFLQENNLAQPETEEDKKAIQAAFEAKFGKDGYRYAEVDGNIKLVTKEVNDRTLYLHTHHAEHFRNHSLGKLSDTEEFLTI